MLTDEQLDRATLRLPDGSLHGVEVILHLGSSGRSTSGIMKALPETIRAAVAAKGVLTWS